MICTEDGATGVIAALFNNEVQIVGPEVPRLVCYGKTFHYVKI